MSTPLNIDIMNVDDYITENSLQEVTSSFIKDTSTGNFDQNGLFSERIFGEIASQERILRPGYISLNTPILHPKLYDVIVSLKTLYKQILTGTEYAVWDDRKKDFVVDESGDTGYNFFIKHVQDIKFAESDAIRKDTKISIFEKHRDNLFINRALVLPAGLREYKDNDGRGEYDDINKIYMSLIRLTRAISGANTSTNMYDNVLVMMQYKVNEIYEYINNIINGKSGFLQRKFGRRGIALGTRNVINATDISASNVDDAALLRSDEVLIPLFQALNMLKPLVIYNLKAEFFNHIFERDTVQAGLINPKGYNLAYITIPLDEKNKFTTSDGIGELINMFKDETIKHNPVTVLGDENKEYYMFLTYRDGDNLWLVRDYNDIENRLLKNGLIKKIYKSRIRPLTYFEMFYIATQSLMPKYATITRYPVTSERSIYPAKMHIASTTVYEPTVLRSVLNPDVEFLLPRFPKNGIESTDGLSPHPSMLEALGADHDGDTVTALGVLSEEGNDECQDYLNSPKSIVGADGNVSVGLSTDLSRLTLYNLSK